VEQIKKVGKPMGVEPWTKDRIKGMEKFFRIPDQSPGSEAMGGEREETRSRPHGRRAQE